MTKRKRIDNDDRIESPKHFRRTIVFGVNDMSTDEPKEDTQNVCIPQVESAATSAIESSYTQEGPRQKIQIPNLMSTASLSKQFALATINTTPPAQVSIQEQVPSQSKNSTQKPSYACRKCGRDDPPIYVLSVIKQMMLWDAPCHLMDLNVTEGQCDGSSVYPHQWD